MNNECICPYNTIPYIIQEGDTLYQIALRFCIPLNELLKANPYLNPYNFTIGQYICIPKTWEVYTNDDYNICFVYPSHWKKNQDEKYSGLDGFFEIAAISSSNPIEDVCIHEVFSRNRDYGTNAKFIDLKIENQEACLVYPSKDQNSSMDNISCLIVKYPKQLTLKQKNYDYLILWVNKQYIRQIGNTLSFLVY